MAVPALAATSAASVDIRPQPLASALQDLARQTGAELLFDQALVRGLEARAVRGRMTAEGALPRLLDGTSLTVRRAASGALIIERRATAPLARQDAAVPEILIVGRRTQNSDIRRLENDVQPYQVTTGKQILEAHRDTIDQYFNSRIPANTEIVPPSLLPNGETKSEIDLRGLGPEATLVLVDGRRLPGIPAVQLALLQSDLNAIPLHSIERVETLTGTAGGIYGFGALGGVVNVVLRRDYRGVELHATGGISSRSDARRLSLEGRLGFTPDGGRTDVMLYLSRVRSEPLLSGQRDFLSRDRQLNAVLAPDLFRNSIPAFPLGNSIGVFAFGGTNLVFKPEFGGEALSSDHSFLPEGFTGNQAQLVSLLGQHAGQFDLVPSSSEDTAELGSNQRADALIATVRHHFSSSVDAYFDALVLRNHGRYSSHSSSGYMYLSPGSPLNPFQEFIVVTFPAPPANFIKRVGFDTRRFTGGLIIGLPLSWRGTAEATFGSVRVNSVSANGMYYNGPILPVFQGPVSPDFNPFGDWNLFQKAASAFLVNAANSYTVHNRYREQSLRLAGPLFATAAGPTTLTLLAQRRRESIPSYSATFKTDAFGTPTTFHNAFDSRRSRTQSFYAELRSKIFADRAPLPLFRDLEVQLAARNDRQNFVFTRDNGALDVAPRKHATFSGTAYTAGAKTTPIPWLTLRGSYATGEVPPPLEELLDNVSPSSFSLAKDPKRGNSYLGTGGSYVAKQGGSPDLTTVRANTLSIGAVLSPFGPDGARLAVDYSRIRTTRDVFMLTEDMVLSHEDLFAGRVTREPLSDADRARGYTAGRITVLDSRAINAGGRNIETIDGRFDWPTEFLGGRLHLYGIGTLQLHNVQRGPFVADTEFVSYNGGPLKWRANGGLDWSAGPLTIGGNVQYFGRYRIYPPNQGPFVSGLMVEIQGSKWVPSQAYFDLYASRRFHLGTGSGHLATVDLGIVNVFDKTPPRESSFSFLGDNYSRYGDPRRRRFELALSTEF